MMEFIAGFVTVDALNEILLPPFIFLITFGFLCCQVAEPITRNIEIDVTTEVKHSSASSPVLELPIETEIEPEKPEKEIVPVIENPPVADKAVVEKPGITRGCEAIAPEKSEELILISDKPQGAETAIAAALDNLNKRQARKLMGGLGLQQKRNGVELTTELMIASIKREFKVNKSKLIQVMRERLPELINSPEELKAAS